MAYRHRPLSSSVFFSDVCWFGVFRSTLQGFISLWAFPFKCTVWFCLKTQGSIFMKFLKSSCTHCIHCICFVSTVAMWEVSRQDLLITGHSTFSAILQSFPWNIIIHSACCFFVTYNRAYVIHMCARTHTEKSIST